MIPSNEASGEQRRAPEASSAREELAEEQAQKQKSLGLKARWIMVDIKLST